MKLGGVYPQKKKKKKKDLMSFRLRKNEPGNILEFVPIGTVEVTIGTSQLLISTLEVPIGTFTKLFQISFFTHFRLFSAFF